MNKEKLYYLVEPGTNDRLIISDNIFIGTKKGAEQRKKDWNHNHELISVKDFENTFEDVKIPPTSKDENRYWDNKQRAAEYEAEYWKKKADNEKVVYH